MLSNELKKNTLFLLVSLSLPPDSPPLLSPFLLLSSFTPGPSSLLLLHPSLPPSSSPASPSPSSSSLISLTSHCLTVRHHLPHHSTLYPPIGVCDQAERQCGGDMWIHWGSPLTWEQALKSICSRSLSLSKVRAGGQLDFYFSSGFLWA